MAFFFQVIRREITARPWARTEGASKLPTA
jgi:hypothetical protein